MAHPCRRRFLDLDEDAFYRIQATYLGMISYSDWIFGQLLEGLEAAGVMDNTAIFVSRWVGV